MKRFRPFICVALLGSPWTIAHAQSAIDLLNASAPGRTIVAPTGGPGTAPMSRPVDPTEYIVGPGDQLQLNLSGSVTRSWEGLVLPEGTLYVPGVGPIQLTGLTLAQARGAVVKRLQAEYRSVTLDLRLLRPRSLLVQLIGESPKAGALEVSATRRATELLDDSLFGPTASRRNVQLRRQTPFGDTTMRLDMVLYRLTGQVRHDPLLREGDVIFLPVADAQANIDGAVARPGRYELAPSDSLSTFLRLAGGPVTSAVDRAVLVRFRDATNKDSLSFQVSDVLAGRFDTPMLDGDRVYVYYQPRFHFLEQATITGEVVRPGTYPLLTGLSRLSDLVRSSGGFLPSADLTSLRVSRSSGEAGEPDPELERLNQLGRRDLSESEYQALRARAAARRADFRVDWTRVVAGGDLDFVLRTGDVVRVEQALASVRVEGEVRLPGLVQYSSERRAEDYIRLAGGYGERAVRSKTTVKRAVTGQTMLARDVDVLRPGDLVWVPEKGDPQGWQNLQSVLLVAAQVATIVLAIRAF